MSALHAAALTVEAWPDLPVGIKGGIAARIGDMAYVGLGSAGSAFFSIDLKNPKAGWVKRSAFAGAVPSGAAAAASGGKIFVFSGNGKASANATSPIVFDTVHEYDARSDAWSKVDTTTPAGLSGAKAVSLTNGRIVALGGCNKALFDKYLANLALVDKDAQARRKLVDAYMGMAAKDYCWNASALSYDPKANAWSSLGDIPFLPNCDAAVVAQGGDEFIVISGEIKPGLRTPEVKRFNVDGRSVSWQKLADLPKPASDLRQEGVAGAFAGAVGRFVLVAGGTNFVGAQANAAAGKRFAHDGLRKGWRDEVYAFDGKTWREIGNLPTGLAYGACFSVPHGVLIVGGEDSNSKPRSEVFTLSWDGCPIQIEHQLSGEPLQLGLGPKC